MTNLPFDQNLFFDTELSVTAPFTGVAQLLGILQNEPVIILFKNQTTVAGFLADNPGATKGTTMAAGEEIIMDCRANNGTARNMGFPVGTAFYVTGGGGLGAGSFKVSILYAK
jgi:hypothetical protein